MIVLCNSVRAGFVGVLFTPVGWLEVFLHAAETCPNSQGLENAEKEFQLLVFHWVWSHVDDDDEASCARDPDEDVCTYHRDGLWNLQPVFGSTA